MINKDTKLFVSVSSHPGNFGTSLYNEAFKVLGVNAIYEARKCENSFQFVEYVERLKCGEFSGISVSMPFKKLANYFVDLKLDNGMVLTDNANTLILEKDKRTRAFNTDVDGFRKSCEGILKDTKTAFVIGRGAVSDSICYVLDNCGIKYRDRHPSRFGPIPFSEIDDYDLLINASPLGMDQFPDNLFSKQVLSQCRYVFDVVNKKETNLVKLARELKKPVVSGPMMCLEGMCRQFQLYTKLEESPRKIFEKVMREKDFI